MSIRLSHLEFVVPDLPAALAFATEVCRMRVSSADARAAFLTTSERHHEIVLRAGATASCSQIAFEVGDLEQAIAQARSQGVEAGAGTDVGPGIDRQAGIAGPDGQAFVLIAGMASHDATDEPDALAPRGLGHVSLKTPDPGRLEEFLVRVLGLRTSDRVEDRAMWLRAGSEHHGVAVMREPPGVHHYAFDLGSWERFCPVADHLQAHGHRLLWGPGRHGPGNNLFAYYLDPQGCVIEYYAELEHILDESAHRPGAWPATPETFNLWGPAPPAGWHDHGLPYAAVTSNHPSSVNGREAVA